MLGIEMRSGILSRGMKRTRGWAGSGGIAGREWRRMLRWGCLWEIRSLDDSSIGKIVGRGKSLGRFDERRYLTRGLKLETHIMMV
ncbi:hypothetical protein M440DRAFT_1035384 [Trichoderma longibrachiatum ATCC 18648]|uniref:Uncharacterized protein n=1 Tax=Trichoderma longibrachiatum ATCC 18648 TaxID=983965 RepID=A0A2T4BZY7_TRILO|nr:hypothetical protein M440DRAFT_1035384 [Trichoderma longibrachiatum ATCC 18648]